MMALTTGNFNRIVSLEQAYGMRRRRWPTLDFRIQRQPDLLIEKQCATIYLPLNGQFALKFIINWNR